MRGVLAMTPADFTGLTLVAPTGVAWRWVGHTVVSNRHGEAIRVERWQAHCRTCAQPFTVLTKMIGSHRDLFLVKRARLREQGKPIEISLAVPAARRIRSFELRNCPEHRGIRRPEDLV
jgi:hypothetical protein